MYLFSATLTNFIISISLWVIFNPTTHCPSVLGSTVGELEGISELRQYFRSNYVFDYLFINFFCMLSTVDVAGRREREMVYLLDSAQSIVSLLTVAATTDKATQ